MRALIHVTVILPIAVLAFVSFLGMLAIGLMRDVLATG